MVSSIAPPAKQIDLRLGDVGQAPWAPRPFPLVPSRLDPRLTGLCLEAVPPIRVRVAISGHDFALIVMAGESHLLRDHEADR